MITPQIANAGCFREHLREAIEMNRERAPHYEQLSNFRTSEISSKLIAGELLAKFASHFLYDFDSQAEIYQAHNIQIVCDEFVPMRLTPAFRAISSAPQIRDFRELDDVQIYHELRRGLKKGFPQAKAAAVKWIQEIEKTDRRFNCMTRHLLESVARIAALAGGHMKKAEALGLPSSEGLSKDMIASHFTMIKSAVEIDVLAAPVQADGIAIICQDVPPISF